MPVQEQPERKTLEANTCLKCGKQLGGRQTKFCCRQHQINYNGSLNGYERSKRYYSKNPRNFFQSLLQKKAKDRQDLSYDFLVGLYEAQEGKCALSGREMTTIRGEGRVPTNISIDRIDSHKGYDEGNVQLVCLQANLMKQQETFENLVEWCKDIVSNYNDTR